MPRGVDEFLLNKGYGIPMHPNAPYKQYIDRTILKLQEGGVLFKLKNKYEQL